MAKSGTPVQLTLYNTDDEPVKELSRLVVPWGILKRALRLVKSLDPENLNEDDLDTITALVAEVFGSDKVTIRELDEGADMGDMLSVLNMVVAKAGMAMPVTGNPPMPREK
jgi:hypothetical protein